MSSRFSTISSTTDRISLRILESTCDHPAVLFPIHGCSFFWRDRGADEVFVASGISRQSESLETARAWLREGSREALPFPLRCFGWTAFDPARPHDDIWTGLPSRWIVLPRRLSRWRGGIVTEIVLDDPHGDPGAGAASIAESAPKIITARAHFTRAAWSQSVERLKAEFLREQLDKAVLSERVTLIADQEFSIARILDYLLEHAPDATVFAISIPDCGIFVGASPERLFRIKDNLVEVESLAGTRPRGRTVDEDDRLSHELEYSRKERREQSLVTDYVTHALESCCEEIKTDAPTVKRLPNVQHLLTRVSGRLREGATLDRLLSTLHPTPAVCGSPTEKAKQWIHALEPFDRGLYTGALGWVDERAADWCVGIRSALVRRNEAHLFAGAGLVAGSDPDQEYEECRWKMSLMRDALFAP